MQGDAFTVAGARRGFGQERGRSHPCSRPRRASAGRSQPARLLIEGSGGRLVAHCTRPRRHAGSQGRSHTRRECLETHSNSPIDHIGVGCSVRRRSAGYIPAPAYGRGMPTGSRRLCGSNSDRRSRSTSLARSSGRRCSTPFPSASDSATHRRQRLLQRVSGLGARQVREAAHAIQVRDRFVLVGRCLRALHPRKRNTSAYVNLTGRARHSPHRAIA